MTTTPLTDDLRRALDAPLPAAALALLEDCRGLKKYPLARLVSIFESDHREKRVLRHQLERELEAAPGRRAPAYVVGLTGSPGAGKSSLIGEVCASLLADRPELRVAVLAVDPSSQASGGSILGDRTRVALPHKELRLFYRSQASGLDLGGVSRKTFQALRALRHFFDLVLVETVGIGQNEIEIQRMSDHTYLVLQPLTGDHIQFIKAGIMEIPDAFVINKCDEERLAKRSLHTLKASLKLGRVLEGGAEAAEIHLVSALKRLGTAELAATIANLPAARPPRTPHRQKEEFYLNKWVRERWGAFGGGVVERRRAAHAALLGARTYEEREFIYQGWVEERLLPE